MKIKEVIQYTAFFITLFGLMYLMLLAGYLVG